MAIPLIRHEVSLDTVRAELVFTRARVRLDTHASEFADGHTALLERTKRVRDEQADHWDAEHEAEAGVQAADDGLDLLTDDFARALDNVVRDRTREQFRRYFPGPPSELRALGLESQLDAIRTWPSLLADESDPALQAFVERFRIAIADGRAALQRREDAALARARHRSGAILRLIDDVNSARRTLYGQLLQRGEERRLGRDWARSFFRRGNRGAKRHGGGDAD